MPAYLKSNLTPPGNLVFADLQWFNFAPCYSKGVLQDTMTSLLGVVTGATIHTFDHTQPQASVMQGVVRSESGLKLPRSEGSKTLLFSQMSSYFLKNTHSKLLLDNFLNVEKLSKLVEKSYIE